jgi:hypothetical protein
MPPNVWGSSSFGSTYPPPSMPVLHTRKRTAPTSSSLNISIRAQRLLGDSAQRSNRARLGPEAWTLVASVAQEWARQISRRVARRG